MVSTTPAFQPYNQPSVRNALGTPRKFLSDTSKKGVRATLSDGDGADKFLLLGADAIQLWRSPEGENGRKNDNYREIISGEKNAHVE